MRDVDLDSPAYFAAPTATLDRLRETSPVHFHAPWDAYVLTRYEDVVRVVRDPGFSVDRGGAIARSSSSSVATELEEANRFFGMFMVFSDPPRHTALRGILAAAFTPARVRSWTSVIDAFLDERLRRLADEGAPFDLLAEIAGPLPARMTSTMLGLPAGSETTLHRMTDDFFAVFGATDASEESVLTAHASVRAAHTYFAGVLADRTARPGEDLLSSLLAANARAEEPLDHDELVALAMTLVAGAYGTTTHLIGQAIALSLEHPPVYGRLVADPTSASGIVEETLRYDGPAHSVVRRAVRDVTIGGVRIPRDARIYCMLHAANHDPTAFVAPHVFDPTRSPNRHLGLGAGAHFCLGASLTRLEAQRTILAIARVMPDLALTAPVTRGGNLSMRGLDRLVVAPRAASAGDVSRARSPQRPTNTLDRTTGVNE